MNEQMNQGTRDNVTFLERDHEWKPSRGDDEIVWRVLFDAEERLCGIPRADWQPCRGVPVVAANVCVNLRVYIVYVYVCGQRVCARLHTHT